MLHSTFKWSPRLVSHQRLLLFREALIYLSYSGNPGNGLMDKWMWMSVTASEQKVSRQQSNNPLWDWSSRQVTLLRRPVINRMLCF